MILKITEKCLVGEEKEYNDRNFIGYEYEEYYANRYYDYEVDTDNVSQAILEFLNNFDVDNIVQHTSHDDFDGECLSSEIFNIEVL